MRRERRGRSISESGEGGREGNLKEDMEDDATQNDRIGEESKQFPNGEEEEDEDAAEDFVPKPSHFLALSLSLSSVS